MHDDIAGTADFLEQMWLVTHEESPLHEVPRGSLDAGGSGPAVRHGPWPAAKCAAVLRVWHAAGWIELYSRTRSAVPDGWEHRLILTDGEWVLDSRDARTLLASPGLWRPERGEGQICLCPSAQGLAHAAPEWYALIQSRRR